MKQLREQIEALKSKGYSLKTKKAQMKCFDKVRELERELFFKLCDQRDKFQNHSVKAIVRWFHEGDDQVALRTPYGTLYGSPTSDVVSKSWYGSTCCVQYQEGQEVIIEIEIDVDMESLYLQLIPKRIYGGILNETKYIDLCKQDNLAFFKYPNGHMSGLFSQKKKGA